MFPLLKTVEGVSYAKLNCPRRESDRRHEISINVHGGSDSCAAWYKDPVEVTLEQLGSEATSVLDRQVPAGTTRICRLSQGFWADKRRAKTLLSGPLPRLSRADLECGSISQ